MSCIYGPHQFGTEDQGWVAHFLIQALRGASLTLYGDGLQVRDVLFVEDLVDAMSRAHVQIDRTTGHAFNIGGGPANTTSLLELLDLISSLTGTRPAFDIEPWRPADQRYYVSNPSKFERATGWRPQTSVEDGVRRLMEWLLRAGVTVPAAVTAGRAS
jgi:CDP-paratose 2-epimerase